MKKIIKYSYLWVLSLLALSSCSDMNDLHQPYLDMGEHIYAARINKAVVCPGNEKLELKLYYTAQRIKKCIIYWNVRQKSMEVDLPESGKDGVPVLIPNMPEGNYSFEIITTDTYGNISLPVEAIGKVYGPNYVASLNNIKTESIKTVNGKTTILWKNIEFGTNIKFTYQTTSSETKTITIPIIIGTKTELTDALPGGTFSYVTYFKPTEEAIEEFICEDTATGKFPEAVPPAAD